jgi:hypothetical protein
MSTQKSACILKEMPLNKDSITLIHYLLIVVFRLSTKGGQPAMKRFFRLSAKGGQPEMKRFVFYLILSSGYTSYLDSLGPC